MLFTHPDACDGQQSSPEARLLFNLPPHVNIVSFVFCLLAGGRRLSEAWHNCGILLFSEISDYTPWIFLKCQCLGKKKSALLDIVWPISREKTSTFFCAGFINDHALCIPRFCKPDFVLFLCSFLRNLRLCCHKHSGCIAARCKQQQHTMQCLHDMNSLWILNVMKYLFF